MSRALSLIALAALMCPAGAAKKTGAGATALAVSPVAPAPGGGPVPFIATAYSARGDTVKGVESQPGIVAADKRVLPLGSTIRVTEAGKYSGLYVVTDLGRVIVGRRIDIYVADREAARAFGRKNVMVELLKPGDNVKFQPETTNTIPKSALAPAEKKDAAAIPSNKVPADKPAVQRGRAVKANRKRPGRRRRRLNRTTARDVGRPARATLFRLR